jgi:membrane-bound lytic murein transglycosylase MltF
MGHNYAKPLTPGQKLERLLERIPPSWHIRIERQAGEADWRALAHAPGQEGQWSDPAADPADALEDTWRRNRTLLA